jgi:hypothetical protein
MTEKPDAAPEAGGSEPTEDEAHRKFREALERKKQAHHASSESARQTGVGPSQNAKTTRQFRRKSGG